MSFAEQKSNDVRSTGLSYKYQRLRESIRAAVANGELAGKLPGERELAQRFSANAKTLSKALTDLAAEGVLVRNIGRGTFVKGSENATATTSRWLVLADNSTDSSLLNGLQGINSKLEVTNQLSDVQRPSFISNFDAVIDLSSLTPALIVRDLLVRGMPVVTLGREPKAYSTHTVLADDVLGAAQLTRELMSMGHRRFAVVEQTGEVTIAEAARRFVSQRDPDVVVDSCNAEEAPSLIGYGATACICDSVQSAKRTMTALSSAGIRVPNQISVAALGWSGHGIPCSGIYVSPSEAAQAVKEILSKDPNSRPTVLWLRGVLGDFGTIAAASRDAIQSAMIGQSRNSFGPFVSSSIIGGSDKTLARIA
jgi:DNA-binding transcriptional regulator YhcF (GntR family)